MKVNPSVIRQFNTFTLLIFDDIFSKEYESDEAKMPYFVAPVDLNPQTRLNPDADPRDLIAWNTLKTIEDYQTEWHHEPWEIKSWQKEPDKFFPNRYVVDPWDGSRKFWLVGLAPQYKPLDPVPERTAPRKGARKNNTNIMEYSCSLWAKARERRTFDENQRVFEARYISLRRNLLDEFDGPEEEETPKKCFIILEPLKISPVSPLLARLITC
jgi:endoribonuclease Dicer